MTTPPDAPAFADTAEPRPPLPACPCGGRDWAGVVAVILPIGQERAAFPDYELILGRLANSQEVTDAR
jgi:hypothetical protein